MSRFRVLKNSFLGGQISRDAVGRTDLPQYPHSCEILQNMIPLLSGGAYRRPGTIFQGYVPGSESTLGFNDDFTDPASGPPRLFPFVVSNQEAFAILLGVNRYSFSANSERGGGYMAYFKATGNITAVPVADFLYGAHPYRAKSAGVAVTGTDEAVWTRQGGPGAAANSGVDASTHAILDIADSLQTYDDDIWSVQYCQANDVMFLTHPDYPPRVVSLNSSGIPQITAWDYLLSGLTLGQSRPYLNQNSTAVTMAVSWTGGSPAAAGTVGTLTCSVPFFDPLHGPRTYCNAELLGPFHEGAFFALPVLTGADVAGGGGMFFMEVLSVTSNTVAVVQFITASPTGYVKGTAQPAWHESAWSNFRGWPRACAIYQQRLAMAATAHQPNSIWFTQTGVFGAPVSSNITSSKFTALGDTAVKGATGVLANGQNYTTAHDWIYYPVDDSQGDGQSTGPLGVQPFRVSLATTSLDSIQYLSPDQQLFIGTATHEWICAPQNGSFDVANSDVTIQSHYGSDLVQACRIGYELMFVMHKKDEVRAYQYNYFDQSFFGEPVQLFFDEYPVNEESAPSVPNGFAGRRKFRTIDWDASRSTLWCVDTAGSLFGLTRDRKLQVTSWHTHQLGGFNPDNGAGNEIAYNLSASNNYTDSAYAQCDGSVISAVSLPNPLSGIRDVWMVVKRSYRNGTGNIWSVERMVGANTVRKSAYSVVAPGNAQEPVYVDCAHLVVDYDPNIYTYSVGKQMVGADLVGTYYSEAWGLFAIATTGPVVADDTPTAKGVVTLNDALPPDYGTSPDPIEPAEDHKIILGYPYTSIIQPVRFAVPSQIGTSQGAIKRISKVYARVFKTLMFKLGSPPPGKLETVKFKPAPEMAQSPEIFTGDKEIFVPANFDREGYLYIVQDQPLPFTLCSLSVEGVEYEQ